MSNLLGLVINLLITSDKPSRTCEFRTLAHRTAVVNSQGREKSENPHIKITELINNAYETRLTDGG